MDHKNLSVLCPKNILWLRTKCVMVPCVQKNAHIVPTHGIDDFQALLKGLDRAGGKSHILQCQIHAVMARNVGQLQKRLDGLVLDLVRMICGRTKRGNDFHTAASYPAAAVKQVIA